VILQQKAIANIFIRLIENLLMFIKSGRRVIEPVTGYFNMGLILSEDRQLKRTSAARGY
jgi:hypothetical protein